MEPTDPRQPIWRWDDEREGVFPFCPVCEGPTCNTPSGNVICLEAGSVFAHVPSAEEMRPDPDAPKVEVDAPVYAYDCSPVLDDDTKAVSS